MKQKSDLSKTVRGKIHCDNASENKKLETDSKRMDLA